MQNLVVFKSGDTGKVQLMSKLIVSNLNSQHYYDARMQVDLQCDNYKWSMVLLNKDDRLLRTSARLRAILSCANDVRACSLPLSDLK